MDLRLVHVGHGFRAVIGGGDAVVGESHVVGRGVVEIILQDGRGRSGCYCARILIFHLPDDGSTPGSIRTVHRKTSASAAATSAARASCTHG
jgi:hypothetical protein